MFSPLNIAPTPIDMYSFCVCVGVCNPQAKRVCYIVNVNHHRSIITCCCVRSLALFINYCSYTWLLMIYAALYLFIGILYLLAPVYVCVVVCTQLSQSRCDRRVRLRVSLSLSLSLLVFVVHAMLLLLKL